MGAGAGLEPTTFTLWRWRATSALPRNAPLSFQSVRELFDGIYSQSTYLLNFTSDGGVYFLHVLMNLSNFSFLRPLFVSRLLYDTFAFLIMLYDIFLVLFLLFKYFIVIVESNHIRLPLTCATTLFLSDQPYRVLQYYSYQMTLNHDGRYFLILVVKK